MPVACRNIVISKSPLIDFKLDCSGLAALNVDFLEAAQLTLRLIDHRFRRSHIKLNDLFSVNFCPDALSADLANFE